MEAVFLLRLPFCRRAKGVFVMKASMAIQCIPSGERPREEAFAMVDAAIAVIDKSGLPYTVGPMETVVEGPFEKLVELAKEAHQAVHAAGAARVSSYIKLVSGENLA